MNEHSFKTTFCGTFQFYVIEKKMVDGILTSVTCVQIATKASSKQPVSYTPQDKPLREQICKIPLLKICIEAPMFMYM